jgi:hypothetical protein
LALVLAQSTTAGDFTISSDDIIPATFIQTKPNIYLTPSGKLLASWLDYRNGQDSYYGQFFKKDSTLIGHNMNIHSNERFVFLSDSDFIATLEKDYSIIYGWGNDESGFDIIGQCYRNILPVNNTFGIYGNIWPWCGTGFMGFEDLLMPQSNSYLYFAQFNGEPAIRRINKDGGVGELNLDYNFSPFKICGNTWADSGYSIFYFGGNKQLYADSIVFGLFAAHFDNQDQLIGEPDLLKYVANYDNLTWYEYSDVPDIECMALNDSLLEIFYYDRDSVQINHFTYHRDGYTDSLSIIDIQCDSEWKPEVKKFSLTNLCGGTFAAILSLHWSDMKPPWRSHYSNTLHYFNQQGDFTGEVITDTLFGASQYPSLIKTDQQEYISASISNNDVYAVWLKNFDVIKKQKLNDDKKGANQTKPAAIKSGDDWFFVTWQYEKGYRGSIIDQAGQLIGNEIELESRAMSFFPDNSAINIWRHSNENANKDYFGITYYNDVLIKQKADTIFSGAYNYYNSVALLSLDTSFITLRNMPNKTDLVQYNKDGLLIGQQDIEFIKYAYNIKLFDRDSLSFYVCRKNCVQIFSKSLEPISPEYNLPLPPKIYLGADNFLCLYSNYEQNYDFYEYGMIVNISGDTIESKIQIAPLYSDCVLYRLTSKNFISLYREGRDLRAQVFWNNGEKSGGSFIIHENSPASQQEPCLAINDNNLLFCWSDNRDSENGYNIMGNIRPLSNIIPAAIVEEVVPREFHLFQNYPNPFNPSTTIKFELPQVTSVNLQIYDIQGRLVLSLLNTVLMQGQHDFVWDGTDDAGQSVASGIYFYRIKTGDFVQTKRMLLMR